MPYTLRDNLTGPQGSQGTQGPQGTVGPTGPTGPTGPPGTVYDSDQVGTIKSYAGATIPTNWMLCDGRSLGRAAYPDLFAALGGTSSPWGLPDAATFNIPDLRSRMVVGAGQGASLSNRAVAAKGGEELHLLTTGEAAQKAVTGGTDAPDLNHTHGATDQQTGLLAAIGDAGHYMIDMYQYYSPAGGYGATDNMWQYNFTHGHNTGWMDRSNTHSHVVSIGGSGAVNGHENMPPWCAIAFIIKAIGVQINAGGALQGATGPPGNSVVTPIENWHIVGAAGEPAFQNNWRNYAVGSYPQAGFRKMPDGRVWLKGLVTAGASGTVAFTLPVGYRPPLYTHEIGTGADAPGVTRVATDGTVVLTSATGAGWFALDGVSFDTEAVSSYATGPPGPPGPAGMLLGSPIPWLVATIPSGYLEFNGQGITQNVYPQLFALFGASLPDLRGRSLYGADAGHGIGTVGGEENHVLSVNEMPSHQHACEGPIGHSWGAYYGGNGGAVATWDISPATVWATTYGAEVLHARPTGGGASHNNLPPYRTVRWITVAG